MLNVAKDKGSKNSLRFFISLKTWSEVSSKKRFYEFIESFSSYLGRLGFKYLACEGFRKSKMMGSNILLSLMKYREFPNLILQIKFVGI